MGAVCMKESIAESKANLESNIFGNNYGDDDIFFIQNYTSKMVFEARKMDNKYFIYLNTPSPYNEAQHWVYENGFLKNIGKNMYLDISFPSLLLFLRKQSKSSESQKWKFDCRTMLIMNKKETAGVITSFESNGAHRVCMGERNKNSNQLFKEVFMADFKANKKKGAPVSVFMNYRTMNTNVMGMTNIDDGKMNQLEEEVKALRNQLQNKKEIFIPTVKKEDPSFPPVVKKEDPSFPSVVMKKKKKDDISDHVVNKMKKKSDPVLVKKKKKEVKKKVKLDQNSVVKEFGVLRAVENEVDTQKVKEEIAEYVKKCKMKKDEVSVFKKEVPLSNEEEIKKYDSIVKKLTSKYGLMNDDALMSNKSFSRGCKLPIYRSKNWLGEFGDRYLSKTEYDRSMAGEGYMKMFISSGNNWLICFNEIIKNHFNWLGLFKSKDDPKIKRMIKLMEGHVEIEQNRPGANGNAMYEYLRNYWMPKLRSMKDNEILFWKGGWAAHPGHAVCFTLIRQKNKKTFSFIISNSGGGLGYHSSSMKEYPISMAGTDARIDEIEEEKVFRMAIWYLVFKISATASENHSSLSLYDIILPYFCKNSFAEELYKTKDDPNAKFQIPQLSGTCFYRSVTFGTRYIMREIGFTESQTSQVAFAIKRQFMEFAKNDLKVQEAITSSEKKLIQMGIKEVVNYSKKEFDEKRLNLNDLKEINLLIEEVQNEFGKKRIIKLNYPVVQNLLELKGNVMENHPFENYDVFIKNKTIDKIERIADIRDINLEGLSSFLLEKVKDFNDFKSKVEKCYNYCKKAIDMKHVQRFFHVIAITEQFILNVPFPNLYDEKSFFSTQEITQETKRELLKNISSLLKIYEACCQSIPRTNLLVCSRSIIIAMFLIIVDALARKQPSNAKCYVAECLANYYTSSKTPGGTSFLEYSSNLEVKNVKFITALKKINEYFNFQERSKRVGIFRAPHDHWYFQECIEFIVMKKILEKYGVRKLKKAKSMHKKVMEIYEVETLARYFFSERGTELADKAIEFIHLRNTAFSFYRSLQSSPPKEETHDGKVYNEYQSAWFIYLGDYRDTTSPKTAKIYASFLMFGKYKSFESHPKLRNYANPHLFVLDKLDERVVTECDVLYNRKLPNFNEILCQEDAENLFTMITAPYLSIPLVLNFFSCSDRLSLLLNREIQTLLNDLLFLPGNWKSEYNADFSKYKMIPFKNNDIGTDRGLLFNELLLSPANVVVPLLKILKFTLCELSTEKYKKVIADTVLYVIRLTSFVETWIVEINTKKLRKDDYLLKSHAMIRKYMENEAKGILLGWIEFFSKDVLFQTKLHAHLALLFKNVQSFKEESCKDLISSLFFINIWYGFAQEEDDIDVPITREIAGAKKDEMNVNFGKKNEKKEKKEKKENFLIIEDLTFFDMVYDSMKNVVSYLKTLKGVEVDGILNKLLWNLDFKGSPKSFESSSDMCIFSSKDKELVINLSLCKIFFRKKIIKPIDNQILKKYDYQVVFGKKPRHCSIIKQTIEKTHLEVVGMENKHEIVFYKKPKVSQYMMRKDEVLESESIMKKYSLLERCVGRYKRVDSGAKGYVTAELKSNGKFSSPGYYYDLEDTNEGDKLLVAGQHRSRGWYFNVKRNENKEISQLVFYSLVFELIESNSSAPMESCGAGNEKYRKYSTFELEDHEKWIATVLEPCLVGFFGCKKEDMEKEGFEIFLPESVDRNAKKVKLLGRHLVSKSKVYTNKEEKMYDSTQWKDIFVYRSPLAKVEVFNLFECARKVYRKMIYTSNAQFSFDNIACSTSSRKTMFFDGYQFEGGDILFLPFKKFF